MSKLGADIEITLPSCTTTGEPVSIKLNGMEIKNHCCGFSIASAPFSSTIVTLMLYGDVKLKANADVLNAVGVNTDVSFNASLWHEPHPHNLTGESIRAIGEALKNLPTHDTASELLKANTKDTE